MIYICLETLQKKSLIVVQLSPSFLQATRENIEKGILYCIASSLSLFFNTIRISVLSKKDIIDKADPDQEQDLQKKRNPDLEKKLTLYQN